MFIFTKSYSACLQVNVATSVPVALCWTQSDPSVLVHFTPTLNFIHRGESLFFLSEEKQQNDILELILREREREREYIIHYFFSFCSDEDENECEEGSPCSHACHNAIGTYYCSCPRGLTISADGRTCQGTRCPHTNK